MPKKTRKRSSRKQRKHRKSVSARGPKPSCCMCGKSVDLKNALIPAKCFQKNMGRAHRICTSCWWGTEKHPGFAQEGPAHNCPGCEKGLLLTEFSEENGPIDLSE